MRTTLMLLIFMITLSVVCAQPEVPIEKWQGKTILLIGAHPDDDMYSLGTLGILNANGNEVFIGMLTTGNVGTQDPQLSMMDLALIRKSEEQRALASELILKLSEEAIWNDAIVTTVEPFEAFYSAEAYHQEYFENNPNQGYCRLVINPKVEKFEKVFQEKLK